MFLEKYDTIVVGAGHAGCEAAAASANLGCKTLLVTMSLQNIAQMSCNPAMGGIAKGQIVREIDALGGYSGIVSDKTAVQFKMLNKSKGPAMWSPRVQSDRMRFSEEWRLMLERTPNLDFYQEMVKGLLVKNHKIEGIVTALGIEIKAKTVILTNGTFLNGLIHIGEKQFGGGRAGESAAHGITEDLTDLGFEAGRMKTGTPPRVDGRSLDYSKMREEPGDKKPAKFSYSDVTKPLTIQKLCHMTYTSLEVHNILREGFDRSPMFNGRIKSIGPRYCPSIEDKINRFADKERHQLFVEPEGWNTVEVYVNGFSTSLPEDVQFKALRTVAGFENVKFFRAGYAIEYDYFPPTQLKHTLETKLVDGLYFAGQINGTTGYEEAASQGLMAGINAALKVKEMEPMILRRDEAYIGVLIDDLITKGTEEPYRMFTSRAEYRTLLRQDNADFRLTPKAFAIGLASEKRMQRMEYKLNESEKMVNFFKETSLSPDEANPVLEANGSTPMTQSDKMFKVFSRPQIELDDIVRFEKVKNYISDNNLDNEIVEQAEINVKYSGYIEKERNNAEKLIRLEDIKIPENFDYNKIKSMSIEAKQKLSNIRPVTISQASRISGVSPADISVLLILHGEIKIYVPRETNHAKPYKQSLYMKFTNNIFFQKVRDYSISKEIFELHHNPEYDLLITYPKPSLDKLAAYYESEDYISHTDGKRSLFERVYHLIKSIALKNKVKLINSKSEKGKLLDIGAGTGDFLVVAKNDGWEITGVEPSEKAKTIATNKGVTFVQNLSELETNSFDVITMWHVLEHVPNLDEYLSELKRLIKPNGTIVIAVPNFKSFDAEFYGKFWAAYDVPRHLWHFSKTTIQKLFADKDMKLTEVLPMKFDSFYVSLLSEKYRTGKMNFIRAFFVGWKSNLNGNKTKEYSSHIYVIKNN